MSVAIDQHDQFSDREPLLRAMAFEDLVERVQADEVLASRIDAFADEFVRKRDKNESDSHVLRIAGQELSFTSVVFTGVAANGTILELCELVEKDSTGAQHVNPFHKMVFLYREDDDFVIFPIVYGGSPVELPNVCWADFRTAENQGPWLEALEYSPIKPKDKKATDADRDRAYVRFDDNRHVVDAYLQDGLTREKIPMFPLADIQKATERPLAEVIHIDERRRQKLGELATA